MTKQAGCELCEHQETPAWRLVYAGERLRVVRVLDAPDFPAFYRVIWNDHVAEMSDLSHVDRAHCMDAVMAVEHVMRTHLAPVKINLATLGNMVPHLHWHVVARFRWDSHFPNPIWGVRQRDPDAAEMARLQRLLGELDQRICQAFSGVSSA